MPRIRSVDPPGANLRFVRDRFVYTANPPASALIGVAALFHRNVLAEVEGIAMPPVMT